MKTTDFKALISLLDDPDEEIYTQIKIKILDFGPDKISDLEEAWEHAHDKLAQSRLEEIIHQIQFKNTNQSILDWAMQKDNDLFEGVCHVIKYQFPDFNKATLEESIEQYKRDVWIELNDNLTALEKIKVINHILFDVHAFTGNTNNYHASQNSYLNKVVETKKGNPLSLSILYAVLAQRLQLPVFGVNLPEHFVLAWLDTHEPKEISDEFPVLFYINAFSKGVVFVRKEIDSFLEQLKIPPRPQFYTPCTNLEIIKRMLRNLINAYEKERKPHKKLEIETLLNDLENLKIQ